MTEARPGTYKFCQHCGQQIDRKVSTCPSCGGNTGSNRTATIIIVLVVLGFFCFVSVAIIGILAAIALPNFIKAQTIARTSVVKSNMRTCQFAVESYATDHAGLYPRTVSDESFRSYYPGGSNGASPLREGKPPVNPFTSEPEWPVDGRMADLKAARELMPGKLKKGIVEYSVILNAAQEPMSYAIRGGGAAGMAISTTGGKTLVLSNQ